MNAAGNRTGGRLYAWHMRGFSLIELMIVVVIVGILAAIAYPSYRSQVREARRTDGQSALVETAQRLERCYTRYLSYANDACEIVATLEDGGFISPEGWYEITGELAGASFTLTATAQGDQVGDTECGNLGLTHTGARTVTGTAAAEACW